MKNTIAGILFILFVLNATGQTAANTWSVKFTEAIIGRWPYSGAGTINAMTGKGWEYSNCIILHGIEKVYNAMPSPDINYYNYIKKYVDTYVNASGVISQPIVSPDKAHPALLLLYLYQHPSTSAADKARYKTAMDYTRNVFVGATSTYAKTTPENLFYHKNDGKYDEIVMLDGVYMLEPFLARYGSMFNDQAAMDTAINQTIRLHNHVYDPSTQLVKHAWTSTPTAPDNANEKYSYFNSTTGASKTVWSRGMGWYVMAVVDIMKYVPTSHAKFATLQNIISTLAVGIKNYQDASSGLWYQVVDKNSSLSGNYIETSGSAMFIYALKTAITNGWINASTYLPVVDNAWAGLQASTYITPTYDAFGPSINRFAPAGSYQQNDAAYVSNFSPVNSPSSDGNKHPHGYAAILMAASVMEFPLIILPEQFSAFTAKAIGGYTYLSWKNADNSQVKYYTIQKAVNGTSFIDIGQAAVKQDDKYTWIDSSADAPTNYYRIKAVSRSGAVYYSEILFLQSKTIGKHLLISPNPIKGNMLNLQVNNYKPGKYSLAIIDNAGKTLLLKQLLINEHRTVETIDLPASTKKGLYYLKLEGEGNIANKTLIVD